MPCMCGAEDCGRCCPANLEPIGACGMCGDEVDLRDFEEDEAVVCEDCLNKERE